MKHTPGPWSSIERLPGRIEVYGAGGKNICVVKRLEEYSHNAQLIVAAPNLLGVAIAALAALTRLEPDSANVFMLREVIAEAGGSDASLRRKR